MSLSGLASAACLSLALLACGGSSDNPQPTGRTAGTSGSPAAPPAERGGRGSAAGARAGPSRRPPRGREVRRLPPDEVRAEENLVRQVVRDFVAGTNARDQSICTRVFDQRRVERSKRSEAIARCRRSIARHPGGLELVKISSIQVRETRVGREAVVGFLVRGRDGRTDELRFHLVRQGGPYRVDAVLPPAAANRRPRR